MKKLLSIVLAIVMIVSSVPLVFAADIVANGECGANGNNATWTLDSDGVLTISGTGAIANYSWWSTERAPWRDYRKTDIKKIVVEEGITTIGRYAFYECAAVTEVSVADSVTTLVGRAFSGCTSLKELVIPAGVTDAGLNYDTCTSLERIVFLGKVNFDDSYVFDGNAKLKDIVFLKGATTSLSYPFHTTNNTNVSENITIHFGGTQEDWSTFTKQPYINSDPMYANSTLHYISETASEKVMCEGTKKTFSCQSCSNTYSGIYPSANEMDDHDIKEPTISRPTKNANGTWTKGSVTYSCSKCSYQKTESVDRANYTEYDKALATITAYLADETITDEVKADIKAQLKAGANSNTDENGYLKENLVVSEQSAVDSAAAALQAIVADVKEKIESGVAFKPDYSEIDEVIAVIDAALENGANINTELTEELESIKADLEELKKDTSATNADVADDVAALVERAEAISEVMEKCANGEHDYDNDGSCTICYYQCLHKTTLEGEVVKTYEDGVCTVCGFVCQHSWDDGAQTLAPTCSAKGVMTYTCEECDDTYEEDIDIDEDAHQWMADEELSRPTENQDGSWTDGYYYKTCKFDDSHTETTGTAKRADYTAYDNVSSKLNGYLRILDMFTDEASSEIVNKYPHVNRVIPDNLVEKEQATVDNWVAGAEEIIAKIENGEYLKADYREIDEAIADVDTALESATISEEMANELADIKSDLEALKKDKNTSIADLANSGISERVEAIVKTMTDCANGVHSFTAYTQSAPAECLVNAEETAYCDNGCGNTDTREIAGTALKHEGGTATCVDKPVCELCDEPYGVVNAENHTGNCTTVGYVEPTCSEGYTGDTVCECGVTIETGEVIPALDHTDADGDELCDSCGGDMLCKDCGRPVHEGLVNNIICLIIMFINLVKTMFA